MDDRTTHGMVLCASRLLCDGKAVGERVEGLFKLALVKERLGLSEQVPLQLLKLGRVDVLANLWRSSQRSISFFRARCTMRCCVAHLRMISGHVFVQTRRHLQRSRPAQEQTEH